MSISDEELEALEPVHVQCTGLELAVTLANGQKITTPLWWYPRLNAATPEQRHATSFCRSASHWPEIDEDLSIEGMLKGAKAPGAKQPQPA
jgi:hypothetical protein